MLSIVGWASAAALGGVEIRVGGGELRLATVAATETGGESAPKTVQLVGSKASGVVEDAEDATARAAREMETSARRNPVAWLSIGGTLTVIVGLLGLKVIGPKATGSKRDVQGQPWVLWLACAVFVYLGGPLVAGAIVHAPGVGAMLTGGSLDSTRGHAVTMVVSGLSGLLVGMFLIRLVGVASPKAGLSAKGADLLLGLMCFVLVFAPVNAASLGARWIHQLMNGGRPPPADSGHKLLETFASEPSNPWVMLMMGCVVVLAPLVEEIMYRGFLQSALLRVTGSVWGSILIVSAAFAAAHLPGGTVPWYALPALFTLSAGMGLAFEKTGRLGVPVVMHMAFNAMNIALTVWS